MRPLLPGLCSVTFRALAPAEVVALAAEAGLAAVEWGADVHVPSGDRERAREVGARTREAGLACSSYGTYLDPPAASLADLDQALDAAEALGTAHLRVWPGARGVASADHTAAERVRAIETIARFGARAAERGASVGLEYHPRSLTDDPASARDLIAAVRESGVFLYWQPAPGLSREAGLAEIAGVGADVCHLHVFAWDSAARRYPLASRREDWAAWIAALPPGRWTAPGYAMLEFVEGDDPDAFRRDARTLREVLDASRDA